MCGFVVISGQRANDPLIIERGLAAIAHRGPDGHGVFRATDGKVAMGHARLAIIDLSDGGKQPMQTDDAKCVITFNGEIYNFRELARSVQGRLRSSSDTEVLLTLLRERGPSGISLLRGMFAFAYWDGEELLLVRDRLGIKPLYYALTQDGIAAGSEIGALLAMGVVDRRPDPRAIDDYLTYLYVPYPRTGILGVHELPPGSLLRWKPGGSVRLETYWSMPSAAPRKMPSGEEVAETLDEAVKLHLIADVPVGVFLSGGLDSSSITALAARRAPGALKTFTVTFGDEGSHLDERTFAREIASQYGTDHTEIGVRADAAGLLPDLVRHFGQPFGNPTAVLSYALSQETRKYVKVALAGDGGDEIFGGYPRYRGVWMAEAYRRLPGAARGLANRALLGLFSRSNERGKTGSRVRRFLSNAHQDPDEMYFRWVTYHDASAKNDLFVDRRAFLGATYPSDDYEFLAGLRALHADREFGDAASLIDVASFLPQNVLNYGDKMSMAHGLEVRVPLCDHVVVERFAPLPLAAKTPAFVQKGLLRWAMRGRLPVKVLLHKKVGFNPPIAAWLKRDLLSVVDDYLGEESLRRRGWFRPEVVRRIRKGFDQGGLDAGYTLWSLIVLEAWMRWLEAV